MSLYSRKPDISTCRIRYWVIWCCTWRLSVYTEFRSLTANHRGGGGLAFIHQNSVQPIQLNNLVPSSFEFQVQLRMVTLYHCREHSSSTRPITLDVLVWRVSRHHINHPVVSYATISTRQLQTTARSVRDWMMCSIRSVWDSMSGHRSGTIRTIYSISSSRINLRIFEMCGSSTQDWCRITNSSLHQSTSPHRPTSNPGFVSRHCSPNQPRTGIHSQIRSTLTEIRVWYTDRPAHKWMLCVYYVVLCGTYLYLCEMHLDHMWILKSTLKSSLQNVHNLA